MLIEETFEHLYAMTVRAPHDMCMNIHNIGEQRLVYLTILEIKEWGLKRLTNKVGSLGKLTLDFAESPCIDERQNQIQGKLSQVKCK